MADPVLLAERVRREVEVRHLEGLGELSLDGRVLVVRWRGGVLPPEIGRLLDEDDTRVVVHSCPYTERELEDAVQALVDAWLDLPFTMVGVGPLREAAGLHVEVAEPELQQARAYFAEHPPRLPDGTPLHFTLGTLGYPPLVTYPLRPRSAAELADIDVERYCGLHVDEATLKALGDGWMVRSYAENAGGGLTLDFVPHRLNLCHDRQGTVTSVDIG